MILSVLLLFWIRAVICCGCAQGGTFSEGSAHPFVQRLEMIRRIINERQEAEQKAQSSKKQQ